MQCNVMQCNAMQMPRLLLFPDMMEYVKWNLRMLDSPVADILPVIHVPRAPAQLQGNYAALGWRTRPLDVTKGQPEVGPGVGRCWLWWWCLWCLCVYVCLWCLWCWRCLCVFGWWLDFAVVAVGG